MTSDGVISERALRAGHDDVMAERGASAVEYALLASLIAVVIAGSVGLLGEAVLQLFDDESLISALTP